MSVNITFAIIGSAGKKQYTKKLSTHHFEAAYIIAVELLEQFNQSGWKVDTLVSSGNAGIDFIPVKLFLDKKISRLKLFLSSKWEDGRFYDNGISDPFRNPGGAYNNYHQQFQRNTNINSLSYMRIAESEGAEFITVEKGFHARNALIAKSDFLLACTFDNDAEIKSDSETADIIRKYLTRIRKDGIWDKSFHYSLSDGKIHDGCKAPKEFDNLSNAKKTLNIANSLPYLSKQHP